MDEATQTTEVKVSGSMIESLRATRPWTKLLAVLGFIGTGLMVLFGAGFMIFANLLSQQRNGPPPLFGLFYMIFSLAYFFPALYLFRYSSALGQFVENSNAADLESALSHQKSFWKFSGIMALIGIIVGVLAVAAAIMIPIVMRTRVH